MALTVLILILQRSWSYPRTPVDIPLWIYFAVATLSLVQPIIHPPPQINLAETMTMRGSNLRGLIQLTMLAGMMICFYATVFFALDRGLFERLMRLFILTGVIAALYGIYQLIATTLDLPLADINNSIRTGGSLVHGAGAGWESLEGNNLWRAHSFFQEPSNLAAYLISVFPLVLVLLFSDGAGVLFSRRVLFVFASIVLLGLVVTWSRLIFVAFLPAMLLMLLALKRRRLFVFSIVKIMLPVVLGVVLIYQLFSMFFPTLTLNDLFSSWISTGGFSFQDVRFRFWGIVIDVWREHLLLGVGLGSFGYYGAAMLSSKTLEMGVLMSAHSWLLGTLAELGLIGFAVWGGLFLMYFRVMLKAIAEANDPHLSLYLVGCLAGFSGALLSSFTFGDRLSQSAWFLMGLSIAAVNLSSSDENAGRLPRETLFPDVNYSN